MVPPLFVLLPVLALALTLVVTVPPLPLFVTLYVQGEALLFWTTTPLTLILQLAADTGAAPTVRTATKPTRITAIVIFIWSPPLLTRNSRKNFSVFCVHRVHEKTRQMSGCRHGFYFIL